MKDRTVLTVLLSVGMVLLAAFIIHGCARPTGGAYQEGKGRSDRDAVAAAYLVSYEPGGSGVLVRPFRPGSLQNPFAWHFGQAVCGQKPGVLIDRLSQIVVCC
jgi:hypothetical protein